jgi:sugar-specific transcriptional regulator TrmB
MSNLSQISQIAQALSGLGLGKNEAILYEILLKNPGATIQELKNTAPFSRTMLYYVLDSLEQYGLVKADKTAKKPTYTPEPPEKLHDFLKDQEKELERQKSALGRIIGDLGSVYRLATNKPGVRFYEGAEGLREFMKNSLLAQSEIYAFVDSEVVEKYFKEENEKHVEQRRAKKIHKKIIALECDYAKNHYANLISDFTQVRLLPKGQRAPFKMTAQIYDNSVFFLTLTEKARIGALIQDENISSFFKTVFEYVWSSLPNFNSTQPFQQYHHQHPKQNHRVDPNGPMTVLN